MCCFSKVCPVPTLLRCRGKESIQEGLHIKCKKEEKEFVSEQEEATFWQKIGSSGHE